jgi:hypothetical protein
MARPLIVLAMLLALQAPFAAQPQIPGKSSVDGVVVRATTGEPLAGARVTLARAAASLSASMPSAGVAATAAIGASGGAAVLTSSPSVSAGAPTPAPALPSVATDRDGRFVFDNLEPGLYSLQVMRNGYARQSYGQRVADGPAKAISLTAGQSMKNIVMRLVPAGNLSGVIRDAAGEPQTGVPVQLLRAAYDSSGQRTFQLAGSAKTDDRGEYRLYWVTPGRYYMSAGMSSGPNRPLNPNNAAASPNEIPGQSYMLTFYPGVQDGRAAAVIDVNPGVELNGIDFTTARQELYRVRGRVIDSTTGQPPAATAVSLAYRTLTGVSGAFSSREKYDPATGEFELQDVPSGYYVVQAAAADAPTAANADTILRIANMATRPNARVPIAVSNGDVNGVMLTLSPPGSISGRLTVDGGSLSSMELANMRVWLRSPVNSDFAPNLEARQASAQPPAPDGSFVIHGVSPGAYVLERIVNLPTGFYVREARFNQTDVLSQPMQVISAANATLEIVLSRRVGQLDGIALDVQSRAAPGAQVVLVPDRQRNRTDLYKTALSDANGAFRFRQVPAGDYRVFAWEALESYAYFDQDLLRRFDQRGVPVHVSESVGGSVTVHAIPANQ